MTSAQNLQVRLFLREALNRVHDACAAADEEGGLSVRLNSILLEIEDVLACLAPEPTPLRPRRAKLPK